jgi:hypothetical protein
MYYYIFEPQQGPKEYERTGQIKEFLSSLGIAGEMNAPTPGRSVEDLVAQAAAKRYSTVIAVGGIELVNRTARALEAYDIVFGIIPTHEHPDITRLIGVSDWKTAAEQLKRRRFQNVRMGSMNDSVYFLTPASVTLHPDTAFSITTGEFVMKSQGGSIIVTPDTLNEEDSGCLQVDILPGPRVKRGFLGNIFNRTTPAPEASHLNLGWLDLHTTLELPIMVAGTPVCHTSVRFSTQNKSLKLIIGKGSQNA